MEKQFSIYTTELKNPSHLHHPISLKEFCNNIKIGTWKTIVDNLRSASEAIKPKLKEKLPYVTLSAIMADGKATNKDALQHSGLLQIDIDAKDNLGKTAAEIKAAIQHDKHLFAVFTSPSGNGIKAVANIPKNIDGHVNAFIDIEAYFLSEYGLIIDKSCKNIARAFFVSYDPEIIINVNAMVKELEPKKALPKQTTPIPQAINVPALKITYIPDTEHEKHLRHIEILCKMVESGGTDITGSYDNFIKIGFAINDGLGEAGRAFYHRICCFHPEYDSQKTDKQYDVCKTPGQTKWPTLLEIAKQNNIVLFPAKTLSPLPGTTLKKTDASGVDKLATIVSSGKPIEEKPKPPSDRQRIENTISETYELRYNIVRDMVECKKKDVDKEKWKEANEHNISRTLENLYIKNCGPTRISSIMQSDFVETFDPFKHYFENLLPYDKRKEPDYIQLLCNIVQLKDEKKDRARFDIHFKKALIRCIACSCSLTDDINNLSYNKHAIIFISALHSIGKTGFVRFLIPKDLELYCTEKMVFGNRDEDFTMASSFLINLDEMASIKDEDLKRIKSAMSTGGINVRKMNTGKRLIQPRRCNFWGNTNETMILKDDTGSVRWLCFEVDGFNKASEYWKENSPLYVDINKVWAQAYTLFKEGAAFQLTEKEIQENESANEFYKDDSLEEQLVSDCFKKCEKLTANHKTTVEIFNILKDKNPFLISSMNIKKLGSYLRNTGFLYGQEYDKTRGFNRKGYYILQI